MRTRRFGRVVTVGALVVASLFGLAAPKATAAMSLSSVLVSITGSHAGFAVSGATRLTLATKHPVVRVMPGLQDCVIVPPLPFGNAAWNEVKPDRSRIFRSAEGEENFA